ncbi:MAG: hypothetical protein CR977_01335 [Gammaproteobacteria bacterium]|nr:MAG: hypothetical protein CR977_01335 [Gammaproteobacteria bacterium]
MPFMQKFKVIIPGVVFGATFIGNAATKVPSQKEWVSAKSSVTVADGLQLRYVEMGSASGKPILLIHGYTDNSRNWSLLAPFLAEHRVIAVDLRGHGNSDAPGSITKSTF